jgi:hypothetical protein
MITPIASLMSAAESDAAKKYAMTIPTAAPGISNRRLSALQVRR